MCFAMYLSGSFLLSNSLLSTYGNLTLLIPYFISNSFNNSLYFLLPLYNPSTIPDTTIPDTLAFLLHISYVVFFPSHISLLLFVIVCYGTLGH